MEFLKSYAKFDKEIGYIDSNNYYNHYYDFGKEYKPESILEIGVRYGYSILSILKGSVDSGSRNFNITGVDSEFEHNSNTIAKINIKRFFKLSKCLYSLNIIKKDINDLKTEDINLREYDIIHLDANHSYQVLNELNFVWPLLKKKGILVLDDVGSYQTWSDWHRTKREYVDNYIKRLITLNEIKTYKYINSLMGTYIITKSEASINRQ